MTTPTSSGRVPGWGFPAGARLRPLLRRGADDPGLAAALGLDRAHVLEWVGGPEPAEVAGELQSCAGLEGVWLDRQAGIHSEPDSDRVPRDPLFHLQYGLLNTGQVVDGRPGEPGADIDAVGAWEFVTGGDEVTVAVFDAGISHSHPDLAEKLVPGWNFTNDSANTDDPYTSHGTHCAGIIGARTSNREGISGVSWGARLMPVVVLNKYGFGNESTLAEALIWAADQGAAVGSVSLGFDPEQGGSSDRILHAAVTYATERGMIICASAGNVPGAPIGAPARYPETIAVGATDNRDEAWGGTSTGAEMTVAAPGVSILSTWDSVWGSEGEDTYASKTGTSQACPHVAGVAALAISANPRLGPMAIKLIIEQTALDLGEPGWDEVFGAGRLDARGAVLAALSAKGDAGDSSGRCTADFNGDGTVDTQDFVAYLDAFAHKNRRADLAEPFGIFDILDVLAFLDAYAQGCDS